ncbi:hypothetical protein B0G84_7333 [Paraburkholderia sp. BL8N3]|nr:hypothetical protein B0G84_7333 [Paraburkholderia sp. BL8N3]
MPRVIDVHQQHALRRPVLEPRMLAAVNLGQFTQAGAACAWLVNLRWPLSTRHPRPGVGHQPAHRFLGQPNAVALVQLLARQRRPKVSITLANDRACPLGRHRVQSVVAGLRAPTRHETLRSVFAQSLDQPTDLSAGQLESLRRAPRLELAMDRGTAIDYNLAATCQCQSKIEMSYRRLNTDVVFWVGGESCLQRFEFT